MLNAVQARDEAILDALRGQPRTAAAIYTVLPPELAQPDAVDRALLRMKLKNLIVDTSDGWKRL